MAQCPDCDAIRIFSDPPEGNGMCSVCHGIGSYEFLDPIIESLSGEQPVCEQCYGSGQCQTCRGSGVVEEYEIISAA